MYILTFDIEEWFHILDNDSTKTVREWANYESRIHQNMDRILDFLDENSLRATFFCLGWIAKKYPEIILEIDRRGFEIASHTYMHQLIYQQKQVEFRNDLELSIKVLEDITGKKVRSFRAPGFSLTNEVLWVFDELARCGIEYDSSIFPAKRSHGGIANFQEQKPHILEHNGVRIKEFPISVKNLFGRKLVYSGGGYFRLLPYNLIKKWSLKDDYVMTYFHPRDFDLDQPIIDGLSPLRVFKSYYGLKGSMNKLRRYALDLPLIDMQEANQLIDWSTKVVVSI